MTLLAYIVAVVALVPALYGGVYGGSRALHHWQHGKCLARIEVLETSLREADDNDRRALTTAIESTGAAAYNRAAQRAVDAWVSSEGARRATQKPRRKPKSGETGAWFGGWER